MIVGGSKVVGTLPSDEIFLSTAGLLAPAPAVGLGLVVSGHAAGDQGSPIRTPDGVVIATVEHNAYLRGPVGGATSPPASPPASPGAPPATGGAGGVGVGGGDSLPPPFQPAGPDVALARWADRVTGLPLTVGLTFGTVMTPVPVTGMMAPTVGLPLKLQGASGGQKLGVITQVDATVVDLRTQSTIKNVAMATYHGAPDLNDSGAPLVTLNPENGLLLIVGFHGGQVQAEGKPGFATDPPTYWFVPWQAAQTALGLTPLPPPA
jgi:hypothetical protein